jgi:hypothetical protein
MPFIISHKTAAHILLFILVLLEMLQLEQSEYLKLSTMFYLHLAGIFACFFSFFRFKTAIAFLYFYGFSLITTIILQERIHLLPLTLVLFWALRIQDRLLEKNLVIWNRILILFLALFLLSVEANSHLILGNKMQVLIFVSVVGAILLWIRHTRAIALFALIGSNLLIMLVSIANHTQFFTLACLLIALSLWNYYYAMQHRGFIGFRLFL